MIRTTVLLHLAASFLFMVSAETILRGTGATFPEPLYRKWIQVYAERTGIRVDYQAVGSGIGIRHLLSETTDFGGTDAFLSDSALENLPRQVLHIPTCVGAVVITYHIQGNPALRFTQELLAELFLGTITHWNDKRITRANPGIVLPAEPITIIHRSEASGTTFLFTDYLSKVSDEWAEKVGHGTLVRWPVGVGAEGNTGVAQFVKRIPGSIGYVELSYAKKNQLPTAAIRNRAGNYMVPSLKAVSAAAVARIPLDCRALLTNTSSPDGYPISAFTYLIFYRQQQYSKRSRETAVALRHFLWWAIHEGQRYNRDLYYARLPGHVVAKAESVISSMRYGDKRLAQR